MVRDIIIPFYYATSAIYLLLRQLGYELIRVDHYSPSETVMEGNVRIVTSPKMDLVVCYLT